MRIQSTKINVALFIIGFYSGVGADFHLLESMISVNENGLYVCTQCGKEQKNKKDLKRHVARKHIQGPIVR